MDDPVRMRVLERAEQVGADLHRLGNLEWRALGERLPQRWALDVRHDVVDHPLDASGVEKWSDVRVPERRGEPDFAKEAIGLDTHEQLGAEHLERDDAAAGIARAENEGASTAADFLFGGVASPERGVDEADEVASHRLEEEIAANARPDPPPRGGGEGALVERNAGEAGGARPPVCR